jgi:hypothetical protein
MKIRYAFAVLACSALVSACNGWPDSADAELAENKPEKFPTYTATPADQTPTLTFENRPWMVSATAESLRGANLKAVGSSGTTSLYAQPGDQAPYGVLYTPAGNNLWKRVLPIE